MGLIKGFGLWLSRSALIFFLIASILTAGAVHLTSQDFIESTIGGALDQQLSGADSQVEDVYQNLLLVCDIGDKEDIVIPIEDLGTSLTFNCQEIIDGGSDAVKESSKKQLTKYVISQGYEKDICSGFDCLTKLRQATDPIEILAIITNENFNSFLGSVSKLLVVLAVISGMVLLLLGNGIAGRAIVLGYPLMIVGLPYFGMSYVRNTLMNILPAQALFGIEAFVGTLSSRFFTSFVIGVVLIGLGLLSKYVFKLDDLLLGKKK